MDRRYSGFVRMIFDVSISPMTATRYLAEFDLEMLLGSRPRDKDVSFEQYANEGYFKQYAMRVTLFGSITTASSCPTHPRVINRFHVSMGLKACT